MSDSPRERGLWTAKLFAVVAFMTAMAAVVVSIALAGLAPLKEVRPFLVDQSAKSEVVATIEPISQDMEATDTLARSLAKQYVIMRHSYVPSLAELQRRWNINGVIYMQSSMPVYKAFLVEATQVSTAVQGAGGSISVDVASVSTIDRGSKYQVEFTEEYRDRLGKVTFKKTFVATMQVEFDAVDTAAANRLVNPTGFTVVDYRIVGKTS